MLKKTKHAIEAAAAGAILLGAVNLATAPKTLAITEEITGASVKELATELAQDDFIARLKPVKVVINSPGGSVADLDLLLAIKSHRELITVAPKFAASAASSIFLMGDTRIVGKDAKILLHNVRIFVANEAITRFDLKDELDRRAAGGAVIKDPVGPLDIMFGGKTANDILRSIPQKTLEEIYGEFLVADKALHDEIQKATGNKALADKVYNSREDQIFNAKESLKEHIATEIQE